MGYLLKKSNTIIAIGWLSRRNTFGQSSKIIVLVCIISNYYLLKRFNTIVATSQLTSRNIIRKTSGIIISAHIISTY